MNRRDFPKTISLLEIGILAGIKLSASENQGDLNSEFYMEKGRELPARSYDLVVAGGGTAPM